MSDLSRIVGDWDGCGHLIRGQNRFVTLGPGLFLCSCTSWKLSHVRSNHLLILLDVNEQIWICVASCHVPEHFCFVDSCDGFVVELQVLISCIKWRWLDVCHSFWPRSIKCLRSLGRSRWYSQ